MQNTLQVGPVLLKIQWLMVVFSALVGYLVIKYRLKAAGNLNKPIIESIENSVVLFVVIGKFSLILFDPLGVITNPLALLYFSGGDRGLWLAAVSVIFYLFRRSKKNQIPIWVYGDLFVVGLLAGIAVYHLLNLFGNTQTVLADGSEVLLGFVLLIMIWRSKKIGIPKHLNQVLLWFSLSRIGIFFLNPFKQNYWLGFSKEQLLYLCLAAIFLSIDWVAEQKRFNRNG